VRRFARNVLATSKVRLMLSLALVAGLTFSRLRVDDRLMIEKVTDRYMLVRPFKTPYLILVDLIKQEGVKLYQQFYSEEDQLASENVGYNSYEFLHYFDLHLEKEEGNTLYFTSRSIETGEIQTYTYTIGK